MQLSIEDISPVEKRVEFEVPWTDVEPRLDAAYNSLRKRVKLSGFRPGKAPRSVLEKMYSAQIEEEVAREVIERTIGQAIQENQIEPIAPPRVDKLELKNGCPFKFSAIVETRSEVEPKNYKKLNLEKRPVNVTDADVDKAIEARRNQLTQFVAVEGRDKIVADDLVLVELTGKVGPHKFKKRSGVVDLAAPNSAPLPGLIERLIGLPVEPQEHELKYELDENDQMAELAGQSASMRVKINEVRARKVPALDDDFAKETGEAETLAGLKEKVRARLVKADEERIKGELSQAATKALIAENEFPIAPSIVQRYAQALVERLKVNLIMSGIEVDKTGFNDAHWAEQMKEQAEEQARGAVLLGAIAKKEGVEVTDGDVQKKIADIAASRQESAKKVRADLEKAGNMPGLKRQVQDDKTLELLLSQAKITEVAPAEKAEAKVDGNEDKADDKKKKAPTAKTKAAKSDNQADAAASESDK